MLSKTRSCLTVAVYRGLGLAKMCLCAENVSSFSASPYHQENHGLGLRRILDLSPLSSSTATAPLDPASGDTTTTARLYQQQQQQQRTKLYVPQRTLSAPFPDGPCGGRIVSLDPSVTFDIDVRLAGNTFLLPRRTIDVWLPPGYDEQSETPYPTVYCHDGQNVVSDEQSWTGRSWRLTGALTRLYDHGLIPQLPIVVLLPSVQGDLLPGVRRRHLEYGDVTIPMAQAHADFVAHTVKPLVDRRFATNQTAECYAMGSSLGGQAALHLLVRHPHLFDGAACLSPCFQPGLLAAVREAVIQDSRWASKSIYLDMGGDMGDTTVPWWDMWDHMTEHHAWNPGYFWLDTSLQPAVQALRRILRDTGHSRHVYHEIPGGRHNERAWSLRIDRPLQYLLGVPPCPDRTGRGPES